MAGDTYSLTVKSQGNYFTERTTTLTCRLVHSLYRSKKFVFNVPCTFRFGNICESLQNNRQTC